MDRYCPVCDAGMDATTCPIHHVPTVSEKAFNHEPAPISNGDLVDGEYTVVSTLGSGAMGTVYLVRDSGGREHALKAMKVRDDSSRHLTKRFYREALAVSRLQHSGVVQIERFAVDERSGLPYLTMELIHGVDLYAYLAKHGNTVKLITKIACQLLDALEHAHQLGIVHRDLKPENVMVVDGAQGELLVKVLDFGIAKILEHDGDAPTLTATGVAVGTPFYMSPEQSKGAQITSAADLYSVACLLYEMLTGAPPFEGADFMSILIDHVSKPPPELPDVTSSGEPIPSHVRDVIHEALSKKADLRPSSAAEMMARLNGGLADDEGLDCTLDVRETVTRIHEDQTPEDGGQARQAPRLSTSMVWTAVGVLLVLLLLSRFL